METKNVIISNHATALNDLATQFAVTATRLTDNAEENKAVIQTLYIIIDALKAQATITQQALENYE